MMMSAEMNFNEQLAARGWPAPAAARTAVEKRERKRERGS